MKVLKAGHTYALDTLDDVSADGVKPVSSPGALIQFVCREPHLGLQPGVQTQEVLRVITHYLDYTAKVVSELQEMLIDRTNHCDGCLPWPDNERIIKALSESARQARLALLYHEQRALERKFEKGTIDPVTVPVGMDGHYGIIVGPRYSGPERRRGRDRRCTTFYCNAPTEEKCIAMLREESRRRQILATPERRRHERRDD